MTRFDLDSYLRGAVDMAKVVYPERWGLPQRNPGGPRYMRLAADGTISNWFTAPSTESRP